MEHNAITASACRILHQLGLPDTPIEPVESFSNGVWLTRDHVVHYHVMGPVGRLEHEARVADRLPPEALYPDVVGVGRDGDHDWLVTKRVPGVPLSEAWPALTRAERREAVHQTAAALRAVHRSTATDLVPPCLQGGAPVVSRRELTERLRALGRSAPFDLTRFKGLFINGGSNGGSREVMAHGDFNFNQVMWYEGRITALLDLEMSHAEGPDWDLGPFLEYCDNPARAVPTHLEEISRVEDYAEAPVWLKEAYPEMFAFPRLLDRLALHELVLRSREIGDDPGRAEEVLAASIERAVALAELLP